MRSEVVRTCRRGSNFGKLSPKNAAQEWPGIDVRGDDVIWSAFEDRKNLRAVPWRSLQGTRLRVGGSEGIALGRSS